MLFFTQLKLANIDKSISRLLYRSKWFSENKEKDIYTLSLDGVIRNEDWVKMVEKFVDIVLKEHKYTKLLNEHSLNRNDLIDIFLLMTIATLPNPIFKTGQSKYGHTLVASAMYQEINKNFLSFLNSLGFEKGAEWEQKQFGHRFSTEIVTFARLLKNAHNAKYGEIQLTDII